MKLLLLFFFSLEKSRYYDQFQAIGWQDYCNAIHKTLTNANLQFKDIELINIKGHNSINHDLFSLELKPSEMFEVDFESIIDVNTQLSLEILSQYKSSFLAWLKKLGISLSDQVDLSLLLQLHPGLTLKAIKANVEKWKNIIEKFLNKPRFEINPSINMQWIMQNLMDWKNILISQGFPQFIIESVDWELFASKYTYVTPQWIMQNPSKFISLLFKIKGEKMPPIDGSGPITPEFIQQYRERLRLFFLKYHLNLDDIDWNFIIQIQPHLTFNDILHNPEIWITKLKSIIDLSHSGHLHFESNIDLSWVLKNPQKWNSILISQGFPSEIIQDIDWELYFSQFPQNTFDWISSNPKQFLQLLLQIKGHKMPTIDPGSIFTPRLVDQFKNKLRIWFEQNQIPLFDDVDWNLVLKFEPHITLADLKQNRNTWLGKMSIYSKLSAIVNLNIPSNINGGWIQQNIQKWINILLGQGFPKELILNIDWKLFVKKYPQAASADWIIHNVRPFIEILLSIQGQKLPPSAETANDNIWQTIFDKISIEWILENQQSWKKMLLEYGLDLQEVDWVKFFQKYPYIDIAWIKQNARAFNNMINLFIGREIKVIYPEPKMKPGQTLAQWATENPVEWVQHLMYVGLPYQYLLTVDWNKVFNENSYITWSWIKDNMNAWMEILLKYQETITDDTYRWKIVLSIHPYINKEWVLKYPMKFHWILRSAGIKDDGVNWTRFFTENGDFNIKLIASRWDEFFGRLKKMFGGGIFAGLTGFGTSGFGINSVG